VQPRAAMALAVGRQQDDPDDTNTIHSCVSTCCEWTYSTNGVSSTSVPPSWPKSVPARTRETIGVPPRKYALGMQEHYERSRVSGTRCTKSLSDKSRSCGGCTSFANESTDEGRDCSSIPNVDEVYCQGGDCMIGEPDFRSLKSSTKGFQWLV